MTTDRITRTDYNETFADGKLVESVAVEVDVTAAVVEYTLHVRLRTALDDKTAVTSAQRITRLERQVAALTRLLVGEDLLDSDAGT